MKAIIIWFTFLWMLFHPTHSPALETSPTYNSELIKQKSLYFSSNSQNTDIYGDYQIIEEEDVSISSKKKVFAKKLISTGDSFITSIFSNNFFKRTYFSKYSFYTRPPTFISLRVLRL
ncbi:MAG TPA: hypothetical protein VFL70_02280 [Bacteroidia bacterium]|nr:hypothetical protein [Bacteroidia bacterium]